jgi:2,3-bisphosphoglycerate-independent phosphoglycerate mutase
VTVRLHQTKGLFGVLTLQGQVSPLITDSNPMQDMAFATDVMPILEGQNDPGAIRCAEALKAFLGWAYHRLSASKPNSDRKRAGLAPINALVTQRAGRMAEVEPFSRRTGLSGALIARGALYRGLGRLLGMEVLDVPEGLDVQTDYAARLDLARERLSDFDFVHVHTKAPDEAAHARSCRAKKEAIEALDRSLEQHMDLLADNPDVLTLVASDHSTPSSGTMIHSGEPVPVIMRGTTVRRDRVAVYDEIEAGSGSLGLMRGPELMRMVLNALDRARMRGIRNSAQDVPYWPGPVSALKV